MPTSNFQPVRLLDSDYCCRFAYLMANSADPDQLASSEANWSRSTLFAKQDISGFSMTRVNNNKLGFYFLRVKWNIRKCELFYGPIFLCPSEVKISPAFQELASDWRIGIFSSPVCELIPTVHISISVQSDQGLYCLSMRVLHKVLSLGSDLLQCYVLSNIFLLQTFKVFPLYWNTFL